MKSLLLALLVLLFFIPNLKAQNQSALSAQSNFSQQPNLKSIKQNFDQRWNGKNVINGYYIDSNNIKQKAAGWKPFQRWYHYMEQRSNPITGALPSTSAIDEYNNFKNINKAQFSNSKANLGDSWTSMGPSSSGGGYSGVGRINRVLFHPTNSNKFWIGSPSGGLWKTTDGGSSWTVLTDQNDVLGVSDIAISKYYDADKTIYIATGDKDGGSLWSLGGGQSNDNNSIGVLKSTDDGITWNTTGLSFNTSSKVLISRLLIDPANNNTLYAATSNGVYKTTNAGSNWTLIYNPGSYVIDMEFRPGQEDTIYIATKDYWGSPTIYRTLDAGTNWNAMKTFATSDYRVELAITLNDSNYLYAAVCNRDGGTSGIYQSIDNGANFTTKYTGGTNANLLGYYSDFSGTNSGQGSYDFALAASPTDKNTLFIGGINTHKSTDGGASWTNSNCWTSFTVYNKSSTAEVHADKHCLAYSPSGDLFETNDGGIYKTTDGGSTWTDLTNGMVISQLYRISVSQTNSNIILAGLQDNGSKLYNGTSWTDVKGGDGVECIVDYSNSNTQYASYVQGQITRTTNNWASTTDIEPASAGSGAWVTPYIISNTDHNIIYAAYADLWKTTDQGTNWTKISSIASADKMRSLAIAPSDNQTIYMADPDQMWVTTNGGTSWTEITSALPTGNYITYIAVHPNNPDSVWVCFGGYDANRVYVSADGGTSFTNISAGLPNIPIMSIVQDTLLQGSVELYVATDVGIYFKHDQVNWQEYSTGLPKVMVTELDIYYDQSTPSNSRLRAATAGRGLWESPLATTTSYPPNVTTSAATSITNSGAQLNGEITSTNSSTISGNGFIYSSVNSNLWIGESGVNQEAVNNLTGTGTYSTSISSLSGSSTYYYKAYAYNSTDTAYGDIQSFTTSCSPPSQIALPFTEDWESYNGSLSDNGNIHCGTEYLWDLETSISNGRAQWGTNAYQANGGSGALTLDVNPYGTYNQNYAILTLNLSAYASSTGLSLSFDYVDNADESHSGDKVWIRGDNTQNWVEIKNLNPGAQTDNTYQTVSNLDIDAALSAASPSQTVGSTFQVRFGQYDNYPVTSGDGISFDNITISDASSTVIGKTTQCSPFYARNGGSGNYYFYDQFTFTVDASGNYDIAATWDNFDGYLYLYSPSFDPNNPATNLIASNDDDLSTSNSKIASQSLTSATNYIVVGTTKSMNDIGGSMSFIINGIGNITTPSTTDINGVAISARSNVPTTDGTTRTANYECTDASSWTHYYDDNGTPSDYSDDNILLSIYKNGNNYGSIGDGSFQVQLAGSSGCSQITSNTAPYVTSAGGWFVFNRYWKVTPTLQLSQGQQVKVRYYYLTADFTSLQNSINDVGGTPPVSHENMSFFKINSLSATYDPNPANGHNSVPAANEYNGDGLWAYTHAASSSISNWHHATFGSDHYGEYIIGHFSGGGGGASKTAGSGDGSPLPISLANFSGILKEDGNLLQWTSLSEKNMYYYSLEVKHQNSEEFKELAQIQANGNSLKPISYSYFDHSNETTSYYRLKSVDFDLSSSYSKVIILNRNNTRLLILNAFPQPTQGTLNLSILNPSNDEVKLEIYSMDGKLLLQKKKNLDKGQIAWKIDVNTLSQGSYILKLYGNQGQIVKRFMVE